MGADAIHQSIHFFSYIFSDLPSKVSLAASFNDLPTIPPTTASTLAATRAMTVGSTTKQRSRTTDRSTKKSTSPAKNTLKSPENLTHHSQQIECPKDVEAPFTLFPIPCTTNKECKREGANQICCKLFGNKRCVEGKNVQPKEPKHERKFFLLVLIFDVVFNKN